MNLLIDLETIFRIIEETGFDILPITTSHILRNATLEFHHQDPFDRIIIAQSIFENMSVVTKDAQFKNYNVPIIWEK